MVCVIMISTRYYDYNFGIQIQQVSEYYNSNGIDPNEIKFSFVNFPIDGSRADYHFHPDFYSRERYDYVSAIGMEGKWLMVQREEKFFEFYELLRNLTNIVKDKGVIYLGNIINEKFSNAAVRILEDLNFEVLSDVEQLSNHKVFARRR